jgi:hypothetical protein
LICGPLLAAPAAAGLWTRAVFHSTAGADFYGLAAATAVLLAEALLLSFRGLTRQLTILAASGFWAGWAWLGFLRRGYDWMRAPLWRAPDQRGWMLIIALVLVWLAVYALAEGRRDRLKA